MDFDHEDRLAIKPDAGGPYFGGRKSWYNALAEGADVSYELISGRAGKLSVENLRLG